MPKPKHSDLEETAICAVVGLIVGVVGFTVFGADAPWWKIAMLAGLAVIISVPLAGAWTRWRDQSS